MTVHPGSAPRRATLRDVARTAGVSLKTASNVLNDSGRMTPQTRRRVQDAIEVLGYTVNSSARSLASGTTHVLSLAVPTLRSPYLSQLAEALIEVARGHGYALQVTTYPDEEDGSRAHLTAVDPRVYDGTLLSMSEHHDLVPADLAVSHPLVCLGSRTTWDLVDRVTTDDVANAVAATELLLGTGATRLAVIGAHRQFRPAAAALEGNAELRLHGIEQACEARGVALDPALVGVTGFDWTIGTGFRSMEALIANGRTFDAVVGLNDSLAIGAISALRAHGLDVPGDVQVVGFDNIDESAYLSPPLTSVDSNIGWIAETAVSRLIARINGSTEHARTFRRTSALIERGTTRPRH
ncbi:LacI family DNA-binding transcriptional regulator [Cellulomonas sp. P5_E12]